MDYKLPPVLHSSIKAFFSFVGFILHIFYSVFLFPVVNFVLKV